MPVPPAPPAVPASLASSTLSHLTPLGPFPSRCKYTGAPPIKTAYGRAWGGGAGVVSVGSLAVLCLPGWQEVWEGVIELAHQPVVLSWPLLTPGAPTQNGGPAEPRPR